MDKPVETKEIEDEETNVYNKKARRKMLREGELDAEEEAFMRGYKKA